MEQVEGVDMAEIVIPEAAGQGAGQGPGGPPKPGRLDGKIVDFHALLPHRPIQRHRQFPGAVLVGGVDAHRMAQAGHGLGHGHAGLGRTAVAGRQVGDDVEDFHIFLVTSF